MAGPYIEKNCLACDALISVRLSDHKRGWGKFCDKSCKAAHAYGQRPRDVNAEHAKSSPWARTCMAVRNARGIEQWPRAARVVDQVGKVKIKQVYHSPSSCRSCRTAINGPGLCSECTAEKQGLRDLEAGWDGHKGMA